MSLRELRSIIPTLERSSPFLPARAAALTVWDAWCVFGVNRVSKLIQVEGQPLMRKKRSCLPLGQ
jgi:hypothetical protein